MQTAQITTRQEKGKRIAQTSRIQRNDKGEWNVPSESGNGVYVVVSNGHEATCSCPDHEQRRCKCKHLWAVEYIVTGQIDSDGNVTITKTVRKTYGQNWKAYDAAQTGEKDTFLRLLGDLTNCIRNPEYKFGRPSLPLGDLTYAAVLKIYTTFSLRRFMSDMKEAKERGYITDTPCYASVGHFLQRKDITPLLAKMVILTSTPLTTVEKDFAMDSTGFGTGVFQRWYSFKHGREISSRRWVKCHFMTGVKTNIITGVEVTSEFENDSPQLPSLVAQTQEHFSMKEISADKAYLGRENIELITDAGAIPFIPFKTNSQPSGNGMLWKKLFYYFQLQQDEFMQHYHKRSNAETTVFMIKAKFGDSVRSKDWTAQLNEVLCKVIAHNICVLIQETQELGINPTVCVKSPLCV